MKRFIKIGYESESGKQEIFWEIEQNLYNKLNELNSNNQVEEMLKIYIKDYINFKSFLMVEKLPKGKETKRTFEGFDTKERYIVEWLSSKKIKYYDTKQMKKIFDILENKEKHQEN